MKLKKVKNKNQETDGYGRYKRPETDKLKRGKKTITENYFFILFFSSSTSNGIEVQAMT